MLKVKIERKHDPPFSFQKLNRYFLMPFFVPIICFTTKFFSEAMKLNDREIDIKDVTEDNTHTFVFMYQIIQSICLILGGLTYFISHQKAKRRKDSGSYNVSYTITKRSLLRSSSEGSIEMENKIDIKKNLIIIFMPILIISYNLGIAYGVGFPQLEKRVYFLFFITLINIFIFKKEIYRHQKLALLITAIGIIPIYVSFGLFLKTDEYNIIYDVFLFIGSFCYSVYLVLIKYLTTTKRFAVLRLLLYQGLLCFAYTIILYIVISLARKGDLTYLYNIFHCSETNYICVSFYYFKIIMYLILNTVLQALIFLVVYMFSPELFAISDIWSPLFSFIALCIQIKEDKWLKIFLTVLGYLIIAVGAFIYNELIVCNFCKLNENTWKAIDRKAYNDVIQVDTKDSFIIDENYKIERKNSNPDDKIIEMTNKE
jgi:hypothetical protein